MKIKDLYGVDDDIEHFVVHIAEEELAAVKIEKVKIEKKSGEITFTFFVDRNDGEVKPDGYQEDLSQKLQTRIDSFHKNYVSKIIVRVVHKESS